MASYLDADFAGTAGKEIAFEDAKINRSAVSYIVAASDSFLIFIAAIISGIAYHYFAFGFVDHPSKYIGVGLIASFSFVLLMMSAGGYRTSRIVRLSKQLLFTALCALGLVAFAGLTLFLLGLAEYSSRGAFLFFSGLSLLFLWVSRVFWARNVRLAEASGLIEPRPALLICADGVDSSAFEPLLARNGIELTGTLRVPLEADLASWIGSAGKVVSESVKDIYVFGEGMQSQRLASICRSLRQLPVAIKLVPDQFTATLAMMPVQSFGEMVAVEIQRAPLTVGERVVKRGFDIAVALFALLVFAPLMLFTALAVRLDSPGPALFRQRRRGFNSEPFHIFKFRSMSLVEDEGKITQATRNDPRITRVGRFIRSTSIDELPQFINVLLGDMSIVGPRPHVLSQEDQYDEVIAKYPFRRHIKPGITGWAQINGMRGETPTVTSMERRLEFDLWYMHHWSIWLDFKIVMRTFGSMFDRKSAF